MDHHAALCDACIQGHLDMVEFHLSKGASIDPVSYTHLRAHET